MFTGDMQKFLLLLAHGILAMSVWHFTNDPVRGGRGEPFQSRINIQ